MNVLLYLILSALLGAGAQGKLEQGLAERLRDSLGPVEKVQVEVNRGHRSPFSRTISEIKLELEGFRLKETPTEGIIYRPGKKTLAGKVGEIQVVSRRFEVEGLPVREMEFSLEGLKYNLWKAAVRRRLEVLGVKKCRGKILLEEEALNRFLSPQTEALEGFHLKLAEGEVEVSAWTRTRLGFSVPIVLTARLQPEGGRIYLVEPRLKTAFIPLPSFLARRLVEEINPVVDLNRQQSLPCTLRISRLRVEPSLLAAEAEVRFRSPEEASRSAPRPGRRE